jgi:uncharacterized membrane protein
MATRVAIAAAVRSGVSVLFFMVGPHHHFSGAPTDETIATKVATTVATRMGVFVMYFIRTTFAAQRR